MECAVGFDRDVGIVTGVVAFGIFQAMFLSIRIKVRTGGLEVRGVAFCVLMKVDGMNARRQILEIEFHLDPWRGLPNSRGTNRFALRIVELDFDLFGLGLADRCQRDHEHCEGEQASDFHEGDYSRILRRLPQRGAVVLRVRVRPTGVRNMNVA